MKKLYHTGYTVPVKKDAIPELFLTRDVGAFSELRGPLERLGYAYESVMPLYAYRGEDSGDVLRDEKEDFSIIDEDDCVVMATRPPLSDDEAGDKKHIPLSHSHLEQAIFSSLRPFFTLLCRSEVELDSGLVSRWAASRPGKPATPPVYFRFKQNNDARITSFRQPGGVEKRTTFPDRNYSSLGFFLHVPQLPDYGCRFIASFGMGGNETAAWNRIVRKRFPEWLESPRFVVASMDFVNPPRYPLTLAYADAVNVDVLLDIAIDDSGAAIIDKPAKAANKRPTPATKTAVKK